MNDDQIVNGYIQMDLERKVHFLISLSFQLTLNIRNGYLMSHDQGLQIILNTNEIQHRLLRMVLDKLDNVVVRTEKEIIEYLLTGFDELGIIKILKMEMEKHFYV